MITISTGYGTYLFAGFINLLENQQTQVQLKELKPNDIKYLLSAYASGRLHMSDEDYSSLKDYSSVPSPSEGGLSVDSLSTKEDKSNKVNNFSEVSSLKYPSVSAVVDYVSKGYLTKDEGVSFSLKADIEKTLATKQTKLTPMTLKTKVIDKIPLKVLDNKGSYLLTEPSHWVSIGDGYVIPVYKEDDIL